MEYREPGHDEFRDLASRILYEDNHVLVFNKRPGEIVQGDKTGDECLADTLKAFIAMRDSKPGKVFLGVPHRLDRPVSGIVVFAKTSKALSRLSDMFRRGEIHKTYWALCCNRPKSSSGELADWLSRNEKQNKSYIVREGTKDAKLARLTFRHIGDTENYSLLEVNLLTGRHHQIRCQLSGIGCVIKVTSSTEPRVRIPTEESASTHTKSASSIRSARKRWTSSLPLRLHGRAWTSSDELSLTRHTE